VDRIAIWSTVVLVVNEERSLNESVTVVFQCLLVIYADKVEFTIRITDCGVVTVTAGVSVVFRSWLCIAVIRKARAQI
jgi:hypothetical protein